MRRGPEGDNAAAFDFGAGRTGQDVALESVWRIVTRYQLINPASHFIQKFESWVVASP